MVFSNRDKRTLLDKMILLLNSLGIEEPFYFVADAYYATGKIVRGALAKESWTSCPRFRSQDTRCHFTGGPKLAQTR